jgi:hypothetical protein
MQRIKHLSRILAVTAVLAVPAGVLAQDAFPGDRPGDDRGGFDIGLLGLLGLGGLLGLMGRDRVRTSYTPSPSTRV